MSQDSVAPAPSRAWLVYALITTGFWGVWGALIEVPEKSGFPATMGYSVWALTMIPWAVLALKASRWRLDRDLISITLGSIVGFTGAGGQLILFEALRTGPAFIVFPVVSLYPALTIVLSLWLLRERARPRHWVGIGLALPAIGLLSYVEPGDTLVRGYGWLALAIGVFVLWGVQAYVMKFANGRMSAESIFFFMMLTGLALVPVALGMTDFRASINWGFKGPYLAALVHSLNSVGALSLVHALRHGKAMIVTPMTALAPVITIALSLSIYGRIPFAYQTVGIGLAGVAIYLMAE